jgi:hypothetical protein
VPGDECVTQLVDRADFAIDGLITELDARTAGLVAIEHRLDGASERRPDGSPHLAHPATNFRLVCAETFFVDAHGW